MQRKIKTAASAPYSAGYELDVSRSVRLKFVALQMPQIKIFLRKFTNKFNTEQMRHKFRRWIEVYRHLQKEYLARLKVQTDAVIPIQSIVRGFNGRNKFRRCWRQHLHRKAEEARRHWSILQLQCFARLWMLKGRVAKRLRARLENRHGRAAGLIQKTVRGFLSRGHTVELEKQKVLRHLRKWSHGISNHLVNMKELKSGYSQSVLFQAISITALPSRPLRDLPKLQYVRTVRRAMILLYWRLQTHQANMREEYRVRQKERREMYLQDLFSNLVEIIALGNAKKIMAEQAAYEEQLLREAREEAHRQETEKHRLILDSTSRAAVAARRKLEADKQNAYKIKLEKLAEYQKVQDEMLKETEFMKLEETLMRNIVHQESESAEQRRLIAQQTKLVEDAKLSGIAIYGEDARYSKTVLSEQLRQLVPKFDKNTLKPDPKKNKYVKPASVVVPLTPGELGMAKYRVQKAQEFHFDALRFRKYLETLPLSAKYVESVYQALLRTQESIEFPQMKSPTTHTKPNTKSTTTTTPSTNKRNAGTPASKVEVPSTFIFNPPPTAKLDIKFISKQLRNSTLSDVFHPVGAISQLNCVEHEVRVKINGMLTRPQMVQMFGQEQGYAMSIAQPYYNMQLQSVLTVDDDAVSKMRLLLQLRHHRQVRVSGYKTLILAHAAFKTSLSALHRKRGEVHSTKYVTRQERKTALSEASALEVEVLRHRQILIDLCSSFYTSFHEEVELFLCLFYPVEMLPEEVKHYEEEQNEMIVSRKVLFASGGTATSSSTPAAVIALSSNAVNAAATAHTTTTADARRSTAVTPQGDNLRRTTLLGHSVPAPPPQSPSTGSPKVGRRSSRMDTVYIAPKRKESTASTSAKLTRSRRESMVYTGPSTKKAHNVDPFHALNQIPVNKTLQRKLAAMKRPDQEVDRKLSYLDYWSGIEQEMQYYAVSPASIVSLPPAPMPTHDNDGKPHILKYGEKGVAIKRIDASHVHKHFDVHNLSMTAKLKIKEAQAKQQKLLKKEVKLHDIPGFNLFTQVDVYEYDFYLWAEKVAVWSKELSVWFAHAESAWRKHNRMQSLTYLLRLQYLAEDHDLVGAKQAKVANSLVRMKMLAAKQQKQLLESQSQRRTGAAHAQDKTHDAELRDEKNSLFLLRHLDQADTLDVFELLLCKVNYGLKVANCESKPDFTLTASSPATASTPSVSTAVASNLASVSRMLSADELDVTVAKHPASITARFIIIQQALHQQENEPGESTRQNLLQLACQNALLFGTTSTKLTQNSSSNDEGAQDTYLRQGIFHAVHPSILLLRALTKEVAEMRGVLSKLLADGAVAVELSPPAGTAAGGTIMSNRGSGKRMGGGMGGGATTLSVVTTEDVLIELQYAKIKPLTYVHCAKDFVQWKYEYPSWMQPVVHLGLPAPEETFFRRLHLEIRTGKDGVYTRINARDNRADEAGRVLLRFLRAAVIVQKYVAEKVLAEHRLRTDHSMMLWEDNLSAAVRSEAEERRLTKLRQSRQNRSFFVKLFDCCQPEVVFHNNARVLHGVEGGSGFSDLSSKNMSNKVASSRSSKRFFKPKYAQVSIWTSEEEFHSVLRAALEVKLPVQKLPKHKLAAMVKVIRNEILRLNRAPGCTIQALLSKYSGLGSAEEVSQLAQRAAQAGANLTSANYFRKTSWVTGQVVHLNSKGEHTDMGDGYHAPGVIGDMSEIYERIERMIDRTCNFATSISEFNIPAPPSGEAIEAKVRTSRRMSQTRLHFESTARRKSTIVIPKYVPKPANTAEKMRIQPEHMSSLRAAMTPVHEVWLGGGLRHLLVAVRVVEDRHLNPRGIVNQTSLILPPPVPHLHTAKNMHEQLTSAEGVQQMRKKLKTAAIEKKMEENKPAKRVSVRVTGKKGPKSANQASMLISKFMRKSGSGKVKSAERRGSQSSTPGNDSKRRSSLSGGTTTAPGGDESNAFPASSHANTSVKATTSKTATAATDVKALDALATISKFLRARKFNLSVSRSSKKYNYNGTKHRTIDEASVRRINNFNARTAGAKITKFFRSKSKSAKVVLTEEELAEIERRKYEAQVAAILAAHAAADKREDDRAILSITITDLFSRARAGFNDRVLCSDRLWRFATHVTNKKRNLCAQSLRVLKNELPVKALPSLHDLEFAFLLAVFRERYKFTPVSNTLKLVKGAVETASMKVPVTVAQKKEKTKEDYIAIIQGLFKIYKAKRIVAAMRKQ